MEKASRLRIDDGVTRGRKLKERLEPRLGGRQFGLRALLLRDVGKKIQRAGEAAVFETRCGGHQQPDGASVAMAEAEFDDGLVSLASLLKPPLVLRQILGPDELPLPVTDQIARRNPQQFGVRVLANSIRACSSISQMPS